MKLELVAEGIIENFTKALAHDDKETQKKVFQEGLKKAFSEIETLFEAAVNEKVADLEKDMETEKAGKLQEFNEQFEERIQSYLDNAFKVFVEDYKSNLEQDTKNEIIEECYQAFKSILHEKSIEVDVEQKSKIDELIESNKKLEVQVNEELKAKLAVEAELKKKEYEISFNSISAGLSETDKVRFNTMCESFDVDGELENKMQIVLKKHFKDESKVETKVVEEERKEQKAPKGPKKLDVSFQKPNVNNLL